MRKSQQPWRTALTAVSTTRCGFSESGSWICVIITTGNSGQLVLTVASSSKPSGDCPDACESNTLLVNSKSQFPLSMKVSALSLSPTRCPRIPLRAKILSINRASSRSLLAISTFAISSCLSIHISPIFDFAGFRHIPVQQSTRAVFH